MAHISTSRHSNGTQAAARSQRPNKRMHQARRRRRRRRVDRHPSREDRPHRPTMRMMPPVSKVILTPSRSTLSYRIFVGHRITYYSRPHSPSHSEPVDNTSVLLSTDRHACMFYSCSTLYRTFRIPFNSLAIDQNTIQFQLQIHNHRAGFQLQASCRVRVHAIRDRQIVCNSLFIITFPCASVCVVYICRSRRSRIVHALECVVRMRRVPVCVHGVPT